MGAVTALPMRTKITWSTRWSWIRPLPPSNCARKNSCERATEQTSTKIPKFAVSGMLQIVRRTIRSRAKIDINDISAIDHTPKLYVPALFCVVKGDSFIANKHSELLHASYAGDKFILSVEGDHNDARPPAMHVREAVPRAVHAGADVVGAREARERLQHAAAVAPDARSGVAVGGAVPAHLLNLEDASGERRGHARARAREVEGAWAIYSARRGVRHVVSCYFFLVDRRAVGVRRYRRRRRARRGGPAARRRRRPTYGSTGEIQTGRCRRMGRGRAWCGGGYAA